MERTLPPRAWLENLQALLHSLRPTSLALLDNIALNRDASWNPQLPADALPVLTTDGFDLSTAAGWLIRLHLPDGPPQVLYLGVEKTEATEPAVVIAIAMCRLAWRLHGSLPLPPAPRGPELREAIHSLRNDLNSVVMNASIITMTQLPERVRPFHGELTSAVSRSLQSLNDLMVLVAPD